MVEVPDEIVARLYEVPPEKFVAVRDEAVAAARRVGDRATATAIGKLRRPTVAAWLVNLLARRRTDLIDELLSLGAALRSAQHDLRGEELRELSVRRRAAIGELVAQARRLAREEGRSGRENLPLAEVEATLTAALAEAEVAEAVRAGTLVKAVDYAGFGEPPRPRLRVIDGGRPAGEPEPAPRGATSDALEKAAEAARTRAREAQAELRRATEAEQDAARVFSELTAQLEDLRERHAQAQLTLRQARLRLKAAQRAAART
jgi:DNA repair exonuclease SbcCD ATPase subunit